ncbi:Triose-phosphate Transporter [Dinochytrium kinnereticum]|nr:Triose-phosphate Transporter [Dinochytrium kinnereticum]
MGDRQPRNGWHAVATQDDAVNQSDENDHPLEDGEEEGAGGVEVAGKVMMGRDGEANGKSGSKAYLDARRLWWKRVVMPGVFILLWFTTSLTLSLYNKWLFGQGQKNFKFPLFSSSIHMVLQYGLSFGAVSWVWPRMRPKKFPPVRDYLLRVLPCGVATGLDIGLSNSSLETISLSFYTMVKSGGPIFVLLFAFWFGLEKPTWKLTGIILIICLGVLLMVIHETHFNLSGYLQVQVATVLAGFRWSITQILLERESIGMSNPFATSMFLAPVMGVCLLIASVIVEKTPWALASSGYFDNATDTVKTLALIGVGGLVAFVMVISEFKLIATTSVVTFSIAGIVKEIITISASAIVFKDTFTVTNIIGLMISLVGIGLYNYVRITGLRESHHHHTSKRRDKLNHDDHPHHLPQSPSSSSMASTTLHPPGDHHRGLLQVAEEFFDVDIEEEEEEDDRAIFAARSGGVFGYNPVTTFISYGGLGSEETELDSFYPVGDIEEEDMVPESGLSKRESMI